MVQGHFPLQFNVSDFSADRESAARQSLSLVSNARAGVTTLSSFFGHTPPSRWPIVFVTSSFRERYQYILRHPRRRTATVQSAYQRLNGTGISQSCRQPEEY